MVESVKSIDVKKSAAELVAKAQAKAEERGLTKAALLDKAQAIKVRHLILGDRAGMSKDDIVEVSERVVSMRLPATKLERLYRSPVSEIVDLFESQYGMQHVKVFSLARNPVLDPTKFNNQIAEFILPESHVLGVSTIHQLCESARAWLAKSENNVVVVHCSDGVSGSGFIVSCLLLHLGRIASADDALAAYSQCRSSSLDSSAPYAPSQIRYAQYYQSALQRNVAARPPIAQLFLESIHFSPVVGVCHPGIRIWENDTMLGGVRPESCVLTSQSPVAIPLRFVGVSGDVRIDVFSLGVLFDQNLFHFCFHTFFEIESRRTGESADSDPEIIVLKFDKASLDLAAPDADNKKFPADFHVELRCHTKLPTPDRAWALQQALKQTNQDQESTFEQPRQSLEAQDMQERSSALKDEIGAFFGAPHATSQTTGQVAQQSLEGETSQVTVEPEQESSPQNLIGSCDQGAAANEAETGDRDLAPHSAEQAGEQQGAAPPSPTPVAEATPFSDVAEAIHAPSFEDALTATVSDGNNDAEPSLTDPQMKQV
eukprot:c13655_g1_i1.p1 GENE.c13655_g1_i1~~c13655_g1_i1.p1  ORF type:complete len:625 (+),score=109.87 c13655_g1_i1:248-1876(+)